MVQKDIKFHPDVLAAHAQFGGDLESMQKLYDWHDMKAAAWPTENLVRLVELTASYCHGSAEYWNDKDALVLIEMAKRMASCTEAEGANLYRLRPENSPAPQSNVEGIETAQPGQQIIAHEPMYGWLIVSKQTDGSFLQKSSGNYWMEVPASVQFTHWLPYPGFLPPEADVRPVAPLGDEAEVYRKARGPEWNKVFDTLHEYRLANIVDEDGYGYPLVDLMTRDGVSISDGEMELVAITDEIMIALAPSPQTREVAS